MSGTDTRPAGRSSLRSRYLECRGAFLAVFLTSGGVNILYLTSSVFMMQVYDRVLGSQSVPTLISLCLFALAAYAFQGLLDLFRQRMLARIGEHVDEKVGPDLCTALLDVSRETSKAGERETLQPFRDLEAVRGFWSGGGALAILDAPWMPIYFALLFLLHPALGWLCVAGAVVLVAIAALTEMLSRAPSRAAADAVSTRNHLAETAQRGAEVIRAMGMRNAMTARWQAAHQGALVRQRLSGDRLSGLAGLSKTWRYMLQSAVLAVGAYLAINGELSAGSIIASSILSSRALSPIDLGVANWKGFLAARSAWTRLSRMLAMATQSSVPMALPAPRREIAADGLFVAAPGRERPIVSNIRLKVEAGSALGIIGPSASGKSTLLRALAGVWPALRGRVLLDGATPDQWSRDMLGDHIGYLPQDVQLFDGTIGQNIARFKADADPAKILAAAEIAGFHGQIVDFPDGYDTRIGVGGGHLSSGQRQKLGLARALYGDPFLVVLDEPNANLDAEGELAVAAAIGAVRRRGGIAIVAAHRPSAIQAVDLLLVMRGGEMIAFGPRDDVLAKTVKPVAAAATGNNVAEFDRRQPGRIDAGARS